MTNTLQDLIDALVAIELSKDIPVVEYLHLVRHDGTIADSDSEEAYEQHALVKKAEGLACEYLITNEGRCEWQNHKMVKASGFNVFPGDKDSFGWLTGCISTKKGILVYS